MNGLGQREEEPQINRSAAGLIVIGFGPARQSPTRC